MKNWIGLLALSLLAGCVTADKINKMTLSRDSYFIASVNNGNLEVVKELVKGGMNVNTVSNGNTALGVAVSRGNYEMAKFLLENHADTRQAISDGGPVIFDAVEKGNVRMLELVLSLGVSPNTRIETAEGVITPLVIAARKGDVELVKLLLKNGADVSAPAIRVAEDFGYVALAALLRKSAELQTARLLGEAPSPGIQNTVGTPLRGVSVDSDVDNPGYKLPSRNDDFAIVVGIEEYKALPRASFANHDAEAVKKHLLSLGIPERNIISLTNENAGRSSLTKYLDEWLPRNVKPSSRVVFYYSGHGAPDPKTGQAYLVPWDGDAMFLQSTAYPVKHLYSQLSKLHVKHVLVALDACFSGAGGRSVLAQGARPLVTLVEDLKPADNLSVLAAASGGEITGTLDGEGHGMFTYFFLKALSEGNRSSKKIFEYLKPHVQDEARRQNREQTPVQFGTEVSF